MERLEIIRDTLKVWVEEWARVQKGENVLITADGKTDKMVLEIVSALTKEKGAKVNIFLDLDFYETPSGSHVDQKYKPMAKAVFESWKTVDRVFCLGGLTLTHHNLYSEIIMTKYPAYSIRLGPGAYSPELLTTEWARFPREILRKVGEKVFERVRGGIHFRLTHHLGTDLTFEASPGEWGPSGANIPPFPLPGTLEKETHQIGRGVVGYIPTEEVNANGVVVSPFCKDIGGNLAATMKLTFVNGWCEKIEGGKEAERLRELIGEERNNRRLQETMMGLNPKISAFTKEGKITYDGSAGAGNMHIAIGREIGKFMSSQHLTPAFLPRVSFYVDDQPLIDKGRLRVFDDPEIREIAKKYGDPDILLSQIDL